MWCCFGYKMSVCVKDEYRAITRARGLANSLYFIGTLEFFLSCHALISVSIFNEFLIGWTILFIWLILKIISWMLGTRVQSRRLAFQELRICSFRLLSRRFGQSPDGRQKLKCVAKWSLWALMLSFVQQIMSVLKMPGSVLEVGKISMSKDKFAATWSYIWIRSERH